MILAFPIDLQSSLRPLSGESRGSLPCFSAPRGQLQEGQQHPGECFCFAARQ